MYENEKYDVEWTYPYMDNYTGPFWSNGKWQKSVAHGDKKPKSRSDSYSRDHDTSCNLCSDDSCLDDADYLYYKRFQTFDHPIPKYLIGPAPLLFNVPYRAVKRFFTGEKYSKEKMWGDTRTVSQRQRDEQAYLDAYKRPRVVDAKPASVDSPMIGSGDPNQAVCYEPEINTQVPLPTVYNPYMSENRKENKNDNALSTISDVNSGGNHRGIKRSDFMFRSKRYTPGGYTSFRFMPSKRHRRVHLEW